MDAPLSLLHDAQATFARIARQADDCLAHVHERERLRRRVLAAQRRRRVMAAVAA